MELRQPLQLTPQYRDYVWGGRRLRPGGVLTAEAWIIYEEDFIQNGALAGRTLADVAQDYPAALMGPESVRRFGARFPVLIKLLDCAEWLSLQVHPNDEQAERLEGPGNFGKTEAWHVLEAAPGAELIAGVRPGVTAEALAGSIRGGTVVEQSQYLPVHAGDTIFMRAGTIHALGPGLLIYEVQQTSDLTYRVFDWNRPQTEGRPLHIEKSLAVADPHAEVKPIPLDPLADGEYRTLIRSPYFTLQTFQSESTPVALDTRGETFHALTVIEGEAEVTAGGERIALPRFGSILIPAAVGAYEVRPRGRFRALKSSVEPQASST